MIEPTSYLALAMLLEKELVEHGFGEMHFKVESLKDNKVKVLIQCGKHHVFFVDKEYKFTNPNNLL